MDTTAPSGTVSINGAAAYTRSTSVSLALSASDAGGVTWMRFSEDGVKWGEWEPYATTKAWTLVGANGTKTVFAQYRDGAGNVSETASDTIVLDTAKPSAGATTPANSATGRARKTNLTVAFSEKMDPATTNKSTFKLYKVTSTGTTQVTNVAVSLSPDGLKATLDPFGATSTLLAAKTKYKAVVTAGAKDLAGNALDQKPTAAGNQPKVWYFTTGAS
ncbi:MAG: Ig-like domain-containing protein [Actinomycetota bacterium]|nr:Ig-like domain-containing protein [Actinomycetota bacterium]